MESKRSYCAETATAPFPTAISSLLKERKITPGELAGHLGVTRQTVSNYCLGQTTPSFQLLCEIADFFNVSTDYLLGRTNVQSPSVEIQAIAAATGLTEHTIKTLQLLLTRGERTILQDLFNEILEIASDAEVIGAYCGMRSSLLIQNDQDVEGDPVKRWINRVNLSEDAESQGFAILRGEEAFRFYCYQIADHIRLALHDRYIGSAIWKKEDSHGID